MNGARLAWGFVLILAILHYDFWNWESTELVFGFLPIGLAYQALISLLAGVAWLCVVKLAWPQDVEDWADEGDGAERAGGAGAEGGH